MNTYHIDTERNTLLQVFRLIRITLTQVNTMDNTIQQSSPSELPKWGPFVALGSTLRRNIQFRGRASRAEFWYTMLGHGITSLIIQALIAIGVLLCLYGDYNALTCIVLTSILVLVFLVYQAFIAIPLLALCVRRMHDIGRSGASLCFYFIPLVGPIILLIFLLTESSGANQYGDAPATVADSSECGKFINTIISIFSRNHTSLKRTAITWGAIILGCWFLLWLVTPRCGWVIRDRDGYTYSYFVECQRSFFNFFGIYIHTGDDIYMGDYH